MKESGEWKLRLRFRDILRRRLCLDEGLRSIYQMLFELICVFLITFYSVINFGEVCPLFCFTASGWQNHSVPASSDGMKYSEWPFPIHPSYAASDGLFLSLSFFFQAENSYSNHSSHGTHFTPVIGFVSVHNAFSESIVTFSMWPIKIFSTCSTKNYRRTRQQQNTVPIFFSICFLIVYNILLGFLSVAECWTTF